MKLQFNLLPDVKQEYLKTQHTKRTVIAAAVVAAALSLFVFIFMLITVDVINSKKLKDADSSISSYSSQLKSIPNLNKILTIQNQLQTVSTLHQSKHITSRLYQYLPQTTPSNVCLGQVVLSLASNSLTVSGTTDTLKSINVYIDTLKFTTYKLGGQDSGKNAFPAVTESTFGLTTGSAAGSSTCDGKPADATFGLTITYDPALFSNTQSVTLNVPTNETTTRSVLGDPSNPLFNGQTKSTSTSSSTSSTSGGQ